MQQYFVEGVYVTRQGIKKARKGGVIPLAYIEPYAKTIWANNPDEAIQIATQELEGGEWTEGPRVSKLSEEQRMRLMGAPEFPGLEKSKPKKRKV
jgi:hypothetical protein